MAYPLRKSLAIQGRVLGALLLREVITRYGRHNIGLLWLIFEPMLYTLIVTVIWYLVKLDTVTTIPIVTFAITGFSALGLWRNVSSRAMTAVSVNASLTYHRNVRVLDLVLSRALLEMVGVTAAFMILACIFGFLGIIGPPQDLPLLATGWFMLGWFGLALGFIMCALSERYESFERIWQAIQYPVHAASGIFFMVDWLPQEVQKVAVYVPMINGVEAIRHGYFGDAVRTHENLLYLLFVNLVMTFVGLLMLEHTSRNLEP